MQKTIGFFHKKGTEVLKLVYAVPKLASICLHKSINLKFYLFPETDKDLQEKIQEDTVRGWSIVFTLKALVDEALKLNSTNLCKFIVGIDASQLYPY